ncbi:MAG TPA: hypothetical protein QGI39_10645, partial [Gammaproteobacteria bacterium]|nr:hypothetical protein [Gammaproteobacteria bacterium]
RLEVNDKDSVMTRSPQAGKIISILETFTIQNDFNLFTASNKRRPEKTCIQQISTNTRFY